MALFRAPSPQRPMMTLDTPDPEQPPLSNKYDWIVTEGIYIDADRLWRTVVVKHKVSKIVYFPFKQTIHSKVDLYRV